MRLVVVALSLAATAAFADDALDARLKALEGELRCLVCQNQTLAESEAPLAADLRKEVRELAQAGKSDDDIRTYLVARYGDFVLFDPPFKASTYVLWIGPFAVLLLGGAGVALFLRRRAQDPARARELNPDEQSRVARLLHDKADGTEGGA